MDDHDPDSIVRQFAQFVRKHESSVFTYVLKFVGIRDAAEDITQEALMQSYKVWNRVGIEVPGGRTKLCFRIARDLSIDFVRKKKQRGDRN
jgi:DNA-directed RNA polymerase specialized sigma24 family protein